MSGWQLAATIMVATFAVVIIVVFFAMREGRSRTFRIGLFVEREDLGLREDRDIGDTLIDSSDWPTRH